jgi:alpha-mannosidase
VTGPGRTVFVVPHTHWDREWYEPSARFRPRLVEVIDTAIELLEDDAEFNRFLVDGQGVLVEDYLEVRPDQRSRITHLAGAGKLLLGPWYVLADELLSSDEALVRNLFVGTRMARALGGCLDVGYSPDAFGHPAAMPTILVGFGIRHGILWRGYGGELDQDDDCFRWVGPDGSGVVVHHLPPPGYEFGAALPTVRHDVEARWKEIHETLIPRAGDRPLLLLNGADHHRPQRDLPAALSAFRQVAPQFRFVVASPADYFEALPDKPAVSEVLGELRFSYRYTWTLQGVHATRAGLKAAISEGDRLLVRWAEPQAALAVASDGGNRRPLLRAAWREHLRNHFHDSLAGSIADGVARDVAQRAAHVTTQARGILCDALHHRLRQERARAHEHVEQWDPALVVVNPSAYQRSGIVEATVTVFSERVVIGPPTARQRQAPASTSEVPRIVDHTGSPVPVQVLGRYEAHERLDSPDHYPIQDQVMAYRVALETGTVPALGLRSYRVDHDEGGSRAGDSVGAGGQRIWGSWCEVTADPSGGFGLDVRQRTDRFRNLGLIESDSDDGDTYTFEPTVDDTPTPARWGRTRVHWRGPLIAALSRDFTVGDRARGTLFVRLDAASRLVRFVVDGENRAGQHRLRILFPLANRITSASHVADMQYGPVFRTRHEHDRREFPREWPVGTAPMHRYVSIPGGLTVFARGLFEYELRQDETLAVTLFRAVGELSRADLAARPGHAAWPTSTPNAREVGRFRAELAVALDTVSPESPVQQWDRVERLAEQFHAPLAGLMLRYGIAVPWSVDGPALRGRGLTFKSLKPAEEGNALALRCVNVAGEPTRGEWLLPLVATRAYRARLDETPLTDLPLAREGRQIRFDAKPREVVTIVVEYGEE